MRKPASAGKNFIFKVLNTKISVQVKSAVVKDRVISFEAAIHKSFIKNSQLK